MDKAEYEYALRLAKEIQWAQEAGQIARALLAANKVVEAAREYEREADIPSAAVDYQLRNTRRKQLFAALRDLDQGKA